MTDRTLTASEHPSGLSPLVEAVRLENAIRRKRRQVEKLATKLQDAEFERQVFEQALERVRNPLVSVVAPVPVPPPEASQARQVGGVPVVLLGASDHDAGEWEETTLRKAYAFDSDEPCLVRRQSKGGDHAPRQVTPGTRLPSRDGEAPSDKAVRGVDDPERGSAVARSGGPGRQPTASSDPGDPPAASTEQLVPSGTAGVDSELPVGVAATAMGGHEAPAQNRQPVEQPSDPATGTTRREPPESARMDASTGAVTDSGGSGAATSTGALGSAPEAATQPEPAGSSPRHAYAPPGGGFHRGGSAWGKQAKDETGNRYGKLVVIERAPNDGPQARWRCGCDCGGQIVAWGILLRKGRVTACRACTPKNTVKCSRCGETGHNVRGCAAMPTRAEPAPKATPHKPARAPVVGTNPAGPTRAKTFTCFKCAGLPHRVEGVRCSGCGLERREEKVRATDFTSGESPLGRAS